MASNSESLIKFQDFVESWRGKNNLQESQLTYGLFMELKKEKYSNRNLLKVTSEFIEILRKNLEDEWEFKCWKLFQKTCISYLFERSSFRKQWG